MLLVDDHTRFMWVYAIKTKTDALNVFKKFKEFERERELKVKTLRSDRGGEFLNNLFTAYCDQTGIKRMFSAPYRNRTVSSRGETGQF